MGEKNRFGFAAHRLAFESAYRELRGKSHHRHSGQDAEECDDERSGRGEAPTGEAIGNKQGGGKEEQEQQRQDGPGFGKRDQAFPGGQPPRNPRERHAQSGDGFLGPGRRVT
jgi:hypothetical protein